MILNSDIRDQLNIKFTGKDKHIDIKVFISIACCFITIIVN